jgi:leucyl aminopeptidase
MESIMDFNTLTLPAGGLAAVEAGALLVIVGLPEAADADAGAAAARRGAAGPARRKAAAAGSAAPTSLPAAADKALGKTLAAACAQLIAAGDFVLESGRTAYATGLAGVKAARIVFVAMAPAKTAAARAVGLRQAVAAGLGVLKGGGARDVAVAAVGAGAVDGAFAEALVAAAEDTVYVYRATKPSAKPAPLLARATLLCAAAEQGAADAGLLRGRGIAAGVALARECANLPGNHCTPTHLAEQARRLAKASPLKVEVLDRKGIDKLGMGSFLAVARGSDEPPAFIVLRYQGAAKADAPVVLVGKGITFDSGGISLKPGAAMDEMKFDMGGAASVLGAFRALVELKPRINVVGLVAACENLPSGRALKPGDVVTSMSGQTIEVLNTDAEGRLILCDALTYAERFAPAAVVDMATLTGACVVALGHVRSGLFSPDDALAAELLAAGEAAADPAWRMPLDAEYAEGLKSNFADVPNIAGRDGGAITAAKFLERFAGKYPWAHLDIAGSAWKTGNAKGATGRPVALLMHFLLGRAGA